MSNASDVMQLPERVNDGSATAPPSVNIGDRFRNLGLVLTQSIHDAHVYGTLPTDVLAREMTFAVGKHKADMSFTNVTGSTKEFIEFLCRFERGEKNGRCILQGALAPGLTTRLASHMLRNHIVMTDLDCGYDLDEYAARIVKLGMIAVIYTTHSHLKPVSEVKEKALAHFLRAKRQVLGTAPEELAAQLCAILKERKQYKASVLDGATLTDRRIVEGGMTYFLRHAPLPRMRGVFFLDRPFAFDEGGPQEQRIALWKENYTRLSDLLGLPYDAACVDPSRLMFTPRIAKSAEVGLGKHEIIVLGVAS